MKTFLVSTAVFFLVLCPIATVVTAQNSTNSPAGAGAADGSNRYPYARFSPSMAVIIIILIAALFFMGFFSIYIRHCSDSSESVGGRVRRAVSARGRRAEAARGLDASVIEGFPTFTYAEVKDHHIGKGALECAVCLNEFEDEETLRLLPKCDHVFHPECVDAWLQSHVTCPVCRANLVPQAGEEAAPQQISDESVNGGSIRRSGSSSAAAADVVIQVNDDGRDHVQTQRTQSSRGKENPGFDLHNRSVKRRMLSFSRFRSHSTGHDSVVQPGENLERFTLRLPAEVRKEVIHRSALNRTRSCAVTTLPREGSLRRGYRTGGGGEGSSSSRAGRFFRRMDTLDVRDAKSDRWVFFTRVFSMKSPKVVAESTSVGEGSRHGDGGGGRTAVKLPSFKCLEPSASSSDEVRLISDEPGRSSPV